jgi:hypothetical protein
MALIYGAVSRKKIIVAFSLHVPEENALSFGQNNRQGVIIVCAKLVFQSNGILSGGDGLYHKNRFMNKDTEDSPFGIIQLPDASPFQ